MKKFYVLQPKSFYKLLVAVMAMIVMAACNNRQLSPTKISYTQGTQTLDARIAEDSFAAILHQNRTLDTLRGFVGTEYLFKRNFTGNVAIIALRDPKPYSLDSLVPLGNRFRQQNDSVVGLIGYLVYFNEAKTPMIITEEVIVEFKPGTRKTLVDSIFNRYEIRVKRPNPFVPLQYLVAVKVNKPSDILTVSMALGRETNIHRAQPNFISLTKAFSEYPNDVLSIQQWHHKNTGLEGGLADADIDSDSAWKFTTGSSSTVIGVIDIGFDMAHLDLTPNFAHNAGEMDNDVDDDGNSLVDDIIAWDFTDCMDGSPMSCGDDTPQPSWHGTNSLGTLAAKGDNAIGVIGSCPDCNVLPIQKAISDFGIVLCFDYARSRNVKAINCSWDFPTDRMVIPIFIIESIRRCTGTRIPVIFALPNEDHNHCGSGVLLSVLPDVISVASSSDDDHYIHEGLGSCLDILSPSHNGGGIGTLGIVTTGANPSTPAGYPQGYTNIAGGNSNAAPLVAGVAGLILTASPNLNPLQVQYLLQDCADKIEPGVANYSPITGKGMGTGGISRHGYGRLNAYEAVKIASAPGTRGYNARNGVDIFVRDNELDWGNTEQPSNTRFTTPRSFIGHWNSMDIKVDAPPYQPAPTSSLGFDGLVDENPKSGEVNKVFVRVRNRGFNPASNVNVKLHWVYAGLGLPNLPSDFWRQFPHNSADVSNYHPLGTQPIPMINYSGCSIAGSGSDAAQIVSFDFTAPSPSSTQPNHYCLVAIVDSQADPVVVGDPALMTVNMDEATSTRNNITHKNYIVERGEMVFGAKIFLYNVYPWTIQTKVYIRSTPNVPVTLGDSSVLKSIYLKPGEKRLLTLSIDGRKISGPAEIDIRQIVMDSLKKKVDTVGGLTYRLNPVKGKKEY